METNDGAAMLLYPNFIPRKRDKETAKETCWNLFSRLMSDSPMADYGEESYSNRSPYFVRNGIAIVPVFGAMMKGYGYPDQSALTSLMQSLKDDASIRGVLKVFDTPGGSVAGTSDYGDSVSELSAAKPCVGYAQDMCCSAGMWIASSCNKLFANQTAIVGSIGVISWLTDASKMFEENGIKRIPLKTGAFKAAGDPSQPATPEIVDYMQGVVDDMYEPFVSAVNKGRGISKGAIKDMNAAVFVGPKAVEKGLVDKICSLDEAYNCVLKMSAKSGKSNKATLALLDLEMCQL